MLKYYYILKTLIGAPDIFYLPGIENVAFIIRLKCVKKIGNIPLEQLFFWLAICSYKPEFFPAFYISPLK
ncbi:MAG: hypothetical protein BGP14_16780 [Sphingobacteriales bacterium 44-15]|nr:MAG: hypothetical protein BGP14_16780 [Sphingobacteriales bacterium 44-15]